MMKTNLMLEGEEVDEEGLDAMGESDEDDHGNNVYQLSVIHITVGWKGIDIGVYPIGN